MPDNLTQKFQRDLLARSKASTSQTTSPLARPVTGSLWNNLGRDQYAQTEGFELDDLGFIAHPVKGLAAGVWQFADTWSFGAAGLIDDRFLVI